MGTILCPAFVSALRSWHIHCDKFQFSILMVFFLNSMWLTLAWWCHLILIWFDLGVYHVFRSCYVLFCYHSCYPSPLFFFISFPLAGTLSLVGYSIVVVFVSFFPPLNKTFWNKWPFSLRSVSFVGHFTYRPNFAVRLTQYSFQLYDNVSWATILLSLLYFFWGFLVVQS